MYEEGFRWWRMGYAAAVAFVLFMIILAATLVQRRLQRERADEATVWPRLAVYAALVAGALLAIVPMLWMLAASVMPAGEANAYPPRLLPRAPTLEHYRTLFARLDLGRYLLNSVLIAATVTVLSLVHQLDGGIRLRQAALRGPGPAFPHAARRRWWCRCRSRCCRSSCCSRSWASSTPTGA